MALTCSEQKVALTGRGILLRLPELELRDRGSSLSRGRAEGRLSQDREGEGECVGEPWRGLLQRFSSLLGESSGTGILLRRGEVGESLLLHDDAAAPPAGSA